MLRFVDRWCFAFDFRRNKALSRRHVNAAREFHRAAMWAASTKSWAVLVDTLFSAAELAAKAWLLLLPDSEIARKASHRAIQAKYQRIGKLNVELAFIDTLNKLSGWRDHFRYLKAKRITNEQVLMGMMSIIADMIEDAANRGAD